MGAYDGAEIYELVGLYILHQLEAKLQVASVGLYRDDGLAVMRGYSGRQADRTRKLLVKIFQAHGLNITAQTNLKSTNFLDTTLDLESGTHKPYRKPNDEPLYIHVKSNHPPTITKHIPTAIEKRIRELSSNEGVFSMAAPPYNAALKKSGYERTISYDDGGAPTTPKKKKKEPPEKDHAVQPTI
ncbi:uncharacterized protein [Apostichopus japonicus]|uniref:uncharacterized protein n=1 Tax=Stichopus japonicus TaxID=307972 RepID=UPI003AB65D0A